MAPPRLASNSWVSSRRDFLKTSALTAVGVSLTAGTQASPEVSNDEAKPFDYIVVGAGSSGCVVANRLTEDRHTRVLLLEAGGQDKKPEIHDPYAYDKLQGSDVDWNYSTEEEPHLNKRKIVWPRGKVLGGSSSINAMIYIRGHRLDYDHWNYLGNEGWSYASVLPYFKKSEDNCRGLSEFHGASGPLRVSDNPRPSPAGQAFVEAAAECGHGGRPDWDFNGRQQEGGAGLYQLTIKGGKRHSAAAAFLTPVLGRTNLTVRTGALVTRLLCQGSRAIGVEYTHAGQPTRAWAEREVIVSAGAVGSPKLLMLSGIGPADQLRAHGIAVVAELPGVGQNLQDHLAVPAAYLCKKELPPAVPSEAGLFLRTRKGLAASSPDLQFHFWCGPLNRKAHGFGMGPTLVRPQSFGSICLRSASPLDPPLIRANYLESEADLDVLVEGIRLSRVLAQGRAFALLRGDEVEPGRHVKTGREVRAFIRKTATTLYHPVGTCKMGQDRMAVVDPQLRVRGVEGLRVVDASVMPTVVNGNTNAPCIMIGERAADMITTG